jgi:tRNA modification GTPase
MQAQHLKRSAEHDPHSEDLPLETIVARATPLGVGAIAIVRISGPLSVSIAETVFRRIPEPRVAELRAFYDENGNLLDEGIVLFFRAPHSFTGEDVVEFQGHGGSVVVDLILQRIVALGARLARPGEFSERAFLNQKIDLVQAEAIADLIQAQSAQAARAALRSLSGEFSNYVTNFVERLVLLRMMLESAIDFSDEEIDFLKPADIQARIDALQETLIQLLAKSHQGALLSEGAQVVIAGKPNAGKSSLLNALAGFEAAIVTDIAGTTRDTVKETLLLDGVPLRLVDTAGIRESTDRVEQAGILRTKQALGVADMVLLVIDASTDIEADPFELFPELPLWLERGARLLVVYNKIDLVGLSSQVNDRTIVMAQGSLAAKTVYVSATAQQGLDLLQTQMKHLLGLSGGVQQDCFLARRRQVIQLEQALSHLQEASEAHQQGLGFELIAESLRLSQLAMDEITGKFSSDDLLGKIFSTFCIGK